MLGLKETKYSMVYLKPRRILPWIALKAHHEQICLNAGFFKHTTTPTLDESLILLGVVIDNSSSSFVSQEDFAKRKEESTLALAEKYLFPAVDSSGAGRHALLKNAQLKAIGRNILCTNQDYFHSWGGLVIQDALKGYVTSEYVNARALLPSLNILGLFLYEEEILPRVRGVVMLRDARTFRLAQLYPNTMDETEKTVVKNHLINYFKHSDPNRMLQIIFENYIHAYAHGIKHEAISPDNLLVDGRWIDTESLSINLNRSPQDLWLQVSNSLSKGEILIEKFQPMEEFARTNKYSFRDSWIHRLYLMCQATHFVYQGLWNQINLSLDEEFKILIKKYFPEINHAYWFKLLEKYDSKYCYKFSMPKKEIALGFGPALDLALNGYYYDTAEKQHILTFSNQKITSHEVMLSLIKRWEVLFNPTQLNWEAAEKLADQIKAIAHL